MRLRDEIALLRREAERRDELLAAITSNMRRMTEMLLDLKAKHDV